jgi:tail tube protein
MAGPRIGGILYLTIDGVPYALKGSWTVTPTNTKREGVAGPDGTVGYTEMPTVPGAKGDLMTVPGLSVTALQAITNSTMTLALANGTTYVLAQAFSLPPFEVDTAEGKVGVEFGCVTCDELVAS